MSPVELRACNLSRGFARQQACSANIQMTQNLSESLVSSILLHKTRQQRGSDLLTPAALQLNIRDFDELSRLYPHFRGRFEQISAGTFHGQVQIVQGRFLRIFRGVGNRSILTRGGGDPGWIDFSPVTPQNEGVRWQGRRRDAGQLVVRGSGIEIDNLAVRAAEVVTLSVPAAALERAAAVLVRSDGNPARIRWNCFPVKPSVLSKLERTMRGLLSLATTETATLATSDTCQLEQLCLAAAVESFFPEKHTAREPSRRREEIVRRGEEYLRAHLVMPVGLIDLCEELGVCMRTVQYAFLERFGVGPIEYLRSLRLNAVRTDLKRADRTEAGVRDVAMRWGFRHQSNFAADYRRLFGELPSETRKGGGS